MTASPTPTAATGNPLQCVADGGAGGEGKVPLASHCTRDVRPQQPPEVHVGHEVAGVVGHLNGDRIAAVRRDWRLLDGDHKHGGRGHVLEEHQLVLADRLQSANTSKTHVSEISSQT